ncbi:MAG TPA: 50S ribosomal protein L3 [Phycisphaerales bacterium]|nr:50S ribosomal protein L3 [Phycisphaerales bacterium]HMP36441.1 50S ribosomal protein L3 [Phycisphaerales bacterium]
MPAAILGRKIGMTRMFTDDGKNIPVTVISAGPCFVTQVKTTETDGYSAVQIAMEDVKARRSTMAVMGHDAKAGVAPKRLHREIRMEDDAEASQYSLGQEIGVAALEGLKFVDVIGTSKGKGFAGTMKRHHFKGLCASHGTERKHRSPGSIGSHGTDRGHGAKIKKGKRMAGQLGNERVTIRSLDLVSIDPENNLLLVKGAVPGPRSGIVFVRTPTRLYKSKARKQAGGE